MNIFPQIDLIYYRFYSIQIHFSANLSNRFRVYRLYADFKLNQSGPHPAQQPDFFFIQYISGNFKMKICYAVIVLLNILPDCHSMVFFAVEGSVHKLHLGNLSFQKEIQLPFYQLQISEPDRFVDRGKAVAAGERAAPAAFIVYDSVLKIFQVFVGKWKFIHIHWPSGRVLPDFPFSVPPDESRNFRQIRIPVQLFSAVF